MRKLITRQSFIFGCIAGTACFGFFLVLYFLRYNPLPQRKADLGINIIITWASIWYFKRNRGGQLHFYEAFSIGFLTNLIGAILSGLLIYLFLVFYDLEPLHVWAKESKEFLINNKKDLDVMLNQESYNAQLKSYDTMKPSVVISDDIYFKQLAIIPISLMCMAMRKLNNN